MPGTKSKKGYGISKHKPIELELPSVDDDGDHNVCLVRRPGPQGLIRLGLLDNLDQLTSLVSKKIDELGGKVKSSNEVDAETVKALAANKEQLQAAMDLVDKVVCGVVVEPRVYLVPVEDDKGVTPPREPDRLYVDEVDLEDKVFILNFAVGGSSDFTSFREQSAAYVESVVAIQDLQDSPSDPAGD
jgi:hypothetical protein